MRNRLRLASRGLIRAVGEGISSMHRTNNQLGLEIQLEGRTSRDLLSKRVSE